MVRRWNKCRALRFVSKHDAINYASCDLGNVRVLITRTDKKIMWLGGVHVVKAVG